jgi:hypothetical protein
MRFKVNDSLPNINGFRVNTQGVIIPDYIPMFFNHNVSEPALGRWNVTVEGDEIFAEPVFDETDPKSVEIKNKVEKGFLNACSMGLKEGVWNEDETEILSSRMREISIVNFPANTRCRVQLYDNQGVVINLNESFKKSTMSKELKKALNLREDAPDAEAIEYAKTLVANQAKLIELQSQVQRQKCESLVDDAIRNAKILPSQRTAWINLADSNFESAKSVLESIVPVKVVKLSEIPTKEKSAVGQSGKTFSQLMREKEGSAYLTNLKETDRESFNQLYKAEFKKDYKFSD